VVVIIFPSGFISPLLGGQCNPYFGGFGHYNGPTGGYGYSYPGFTFPFNFQSPYRYALQSRFISE
jgi:hypothetical protein